MTNIDIVLTYSASTTCPQLGMHGVPGYTFLNGPSGSCADGFFPIDGQLLGNSYRAFNPRSDFWQRTWLAECVTSLVSASCSPAKTHQP